MPLFVVACSARIRINVAHPSLILTPGYQYHHASAAKRPVLSSLVACILCLLLRSAQPLLRRICLRKALSVNGPISTQGPAASVLVVVAASCFCATAA